MYLEKDTHIDLYYGYYIRNSDEVYDKSKIFKINNHLYVDGNNQYAGLSSLLNHCPHANCIAVVGTDYKYKFPVIIIKTSRNILPHEELTLKYSSNVDFDNHCKCLYCDQ